MNDDIKKIDLFTHEIKYYVLGFLFSIILTGVPFLIAIKKKYFTFKFLILIFVFFAILQIFVHLKYFLHLTCSKKYNWVIMFFIFSLIVIFIIILGSIGIMYNLNHNLMSH